MNKITVIQLLNKIANGEVPKKIKYNGYEFEYDEYKGEWGYVNKIETPYLWFAKYIDCDLQKTLNDEVELIRELNELKKGK
jgi:hypothetical protein